MTREKIIQGLYRGDSRAIKEAIKALEKEPGKGHWIDHSDEGYVECSNCGSATNCDGTVADLHFCFNCGAEMDEDGRTLKYSDQDTMMQATQKGDSGE